MIRRSSLILCLLFLTTSWIYADQGGDDSYGYMWTNSNGATSIDYEWINAKDGTRLFTALGGIAHNTIYISTNGWVSFSNPGGAHSANSPIPSAGPPDSIIAIFWDNMTSLTGTGGAPGVYYKTIGSYPNRKFVVAWDGYYFAAPNQEVSFELILYETSNLIKLQYNYINNGATIWPTPVIGIEADGTDGIQYPAAAVTNNSAVLFHNKYLLSGASSDISPNTVTVGGSPQQFAYTF
ncbi:MAG: hypothetical protein P8Y99_04665, partial [Calditrichaceae bacterium]